MTSESAPVIISAVVCTRNARRRIHETLVGLRHQSLDRAAYEVIVVDNASDDGSAEWLAARQAEFSFRLLREPEPGLCAARNRGVVEARGSIVFFIDDDAIAPAHHLEALARNFQEPRADAVGGPVHGLWEASPPRWLAARHWRGLSLVSYGARRRTLRFPEILLGTNMAFRRTLFEEIGLFNIGLGRRGESLVGGEDREIQSRIAEAGGKVLYDPRCYVFHKVPRSRMTLAYFERRTRDEAYAHEMQRLMKGGAEPLQERLSRLDRRFLGGFVNIVKAIAGSISYYGYDGTQILSQLRIGWIRKAEADARRDFAAGKRGIN